MCSCKGQRFNKPVVAMPANPDGRGYQLVGADGADGVIFSFADARLYGSMGGKPLNKPVVAIATT